MEPGATARHVVAWLFIAAMAHGCQFVLSGDAVQCSSDDDCPTGPPSLVCVNGLCVEGEVHGATSDDGTEASTSTGIDLACEPATECVPAAAAGWSGPVIAIATQREPAPCPASAPTVVATGHAGLTADEAVCACSCDATDMGCDVTIYGSFGGCSETFAAPLTEDACATINFVGVLGPGGDAVLPPMFDGCTPVVTEQIQPFEWSEHVRLCEAPAAECGTGVCMPIPDPLTGAATCIWREGEHACTDPVYSRKSVFHGGVSDLRDCSACTCGERSSCRLSIHDDPACDDEPFFETLLDEMQCLLLDDVFPSPQNAIGAVVRRVDSSTGACEPTGGIATGAATEVDTFTVCCRP